MKNNNIFLFYIKNKPKIIFNYIIAIFVSFFPYLLTLILNQIFSSILGVEYLKIMYYIIFYVFIMLFNELIILNNNFSIRKNNEYISKKVLDDIYISTFKVEPINFEDEKWLIKHSRVQKINSCVSDAFMSLIVLTMQLMTLFTYFIYLFEYISIYAFISLLIVIPPIISSVFNSKYKYKMERKNAYEKSRVRAVENMFFNVNFLSEMKIFSSIKNVISLWKKRKNNLFEKEVKLEIRFLLINSIILIASMAIVIFTLTIFYFNTKNNINDTIKIITLIPFMLSIINSAARTASNIKGISYSKKEYNEVRSFINDNFLDVRKGNLSFNKINKIELKNVSFKYPSSDKYVLENINLKIDNSRIIAFVGENGSGKSTLLKLITGIYKPISGKVYINDYDVSDIDMDCIKRNISFVFQFPIKYPLNVIENIDLNGNVSSNEIKSLMNELNLNISKESLYNKILQPGLSNSADISGGQWQKIAILRAIMNERSNIYVFDEPTATLDPQAEIEVYNNFINLTKNKIAFLATHRLGLAKKADLIVVLEKGKLIDLGTHEELLVRCNEYQELYNSQAEWYRDGESNI